jgi:uncharacterized protein YdcH (DUF465 family)
MEKRDEELIQSLLSFDPELKQYYEEHLALEQRLSEFNRRLYLTPEQELEKKQIQKLKLSGKDKIMQILEKHRGAAERPPGAGRDASVG